ncbi:hypothetical protein FRC12_003317 [Ceratobasidium sp. 428]|nr:hypothetical protein FRC12_003317 [Ceratobasidium sp. 428]
MSVSPQTTLAALVELTRGVSSGVRLRPVGSPFGQRAHRHTRLVSYTINPLAQCRSTKQAAAWRIGLLSLRVQTRYARDRPDPPRYLPKFTDSPAHSNLLRSRLNGTTNASALRRKCIPPRSANLAKQA